MLEDEVGIVKVTIARYGTKGNDLARGKGIHNGSRYDEVGMDLFQLFHCQEAFV